MKLNKARKSAQIVLKFSLGNVHVNGLHLGVRMQAFYTILTAISRIFESPKWDMNLLEKKLG
jgi:hypothetical protein